MPGPIPRNSNTLQNNGNIDQASAGHPPEVSAGSPASARNGQPRAGLSIQPNAGNTAPRAAFGVLPSNARANARIDVPSEEALINVRMRAPLQPARAEIMDVPADVEMESDDDIIIPATSEGRLQRIAELEDDVRDLRTSNAVFRGHIEARRVQLDMTQAARRRLEGDGPQTLEIENDLAVMRRFGEDGSRTLAIENSAAVMRSFGRDEAQRLAIGNMRAAMRRLQGNEDQRQVAASARAGTRAVEELNAASETTLFEDTQRQI